MSNDVPEGFVGQNPLTNSPLSSAVTALMDDTVYLMDDTAATMGGQTTIYDSLPTGMILTQVVGK